MTDRTINLFFAPMFGYDHKPLRERVKLLTGLDKYTKAEITTEGYGSAIEEVNLSISYHKRADELSEAAAGINTKDAVPVYIDALYLYIRSQALSADDTFAFITKQKQLCKYVDLLLSETRKHNLQSQKDVLKWVAFNLKMQCLFREIDPIVKHADAKAISYLSNEVKTLGLLFCSRGFKDYTLVGIEDLENEMRRKFNS